jgi:hypothetical protein
MCSKLVEDNLLEINDWEKVCMLLVFLTYVYHDARFRECKTKTCWKTEWWTRRYLRGGVRTGHRRCVRLCFVDFGSHSSVAECSGLLISYDLSSGKLLTKFRRCVVPSPSGFSNSICFVWNIKTFWSSATSVPFTSRHGITPQKIWIFVLLWLELLIQYC